MHNNEKDLLPKKVWNIITEACFGGDWELYKSYKGKRFPVEYSTALGFAKTHGIDTVEKAMAFRAFINPVKVEKPKPVVDTKIFNGTITIGSLIVPTSSTKPITVSDGSGSGKVRVSRNPRNLSDAERIQNTLAQSVWRVRENNFRLAVEDPDGFEAAGRMAEGLWRERFLSLNDCSAAAVAMLDQLHYPKAVMSLWIKKYERNK
jgi:hypothetical protein